jgi:lipoic acid synthetase
LKAQPKIRVQKPHWLKKQLPSGPDYEKVKFLITRGRLHTVCQEAKCPNIWECFSEHTATFLILGDHCTRDCRFCAVTYGALEPPDPGEPSRVAKAAQDMGLRYVVITSVTRDDLPDGGAGLFAETIREIRNRMPDTKVEVLIPDFQGKTEALNTVLQAYPDVLNHNLETVPRLYPTVRPEAIYDRSLELLKRVHIFDSAIPTKSGLMLGLGETSEEIHQTLLDLLEAGCRILTLGQYLQPSQQHLPVARFLTPDEFDHWRETGYSLGFAEVASGPFVRSSYRAHELFKTVQS